MKLKLIDIFKILKEALWEDRVDRYLFLLSLLLFTISFTLWHFLIAPRNLMIYSRFNIYPLRLLSIILILNTLLAVFSVRKEKEISYLLFIANCICAFLVVVLEIFYLLNY